MRCEHRDIVIIEYGTLNTAHARNVDGTWEHESKPGGYTGKVWVKCRVCGLDREYKRKKPKWLLEMLEEIGIPFL
jgi:hypothetical protein